MKKILIISLIVSSSFSFLLISSNVCAQRPEMLSRRTGSMAQLSLSSPAFENKSPIPAKYTEDGQDVSPALSWTGVPEQTRELALIVDDPDAPRKDPWVHWVIFKIPPEVNKLDEGVLRQPVLKNIEGVLQGKNSWNTVGYRGPAPPPGKAHRYFFRLYALDKPLDLQAGATKEELLSAMKGHILSIGEYLGTYQR